jgi:hypothetical protein
MFCVPRHVVGGAEGVGSCFHVLRSRTSFQRYSGRRLLISCFELSESFSRDTLGVGFCFHVLRSRTRFQRHREGQVPFSCFAFSDIFLAVRRAEAPILMLCAPRLVFGGTVGVGSRFHVLRARTHFPRYRGRRVLFSCSAFPDKFLAVRRA